MRVRRSQRRGLKKLEVALLLLLFLTALGLFITFLPPAHESASRAECAFHLKEIGDAVQRYHTRTKTLPPSRLGEAHATWAVLIAADLSAKGGVESLCRWDAALPYADQADAVRQAQVPLYFCPARRRPPHNSADPGTESPGALGDYAASAGDGDPKRPWDSDDVNAALVPAEVLERKGSSLLRWRSRTSLESLARGLNYTILIGDKHIPAGAWGLVASGDGSLYNGAQPASYLRVAGPGYGLARSPDEPFHRDFGGAHPGSVCQFLTAENAVQAFTPDVSPEVLGRLMVRDAPPGWEKSQEKK